MLLGVFCDLGLLYIHLLNVVFSPPQFGMIPKHWMYMWARAPPSFCSTALAHTLLFRLLRGGGDEKSSVSNKTQLTYYPPYCSQIIHSVLFFLIIFFGEGHSLCLLFYFCDSPILFLALLQWQASREHLKHICPLFPATTVKSVLTACENNRDACMLSWHGHVKPRTHDAKW